ncbi:MAG: MBL fold metallo-hydrolase, partial [Anaerolineae bacterium]
MAVAALPHYPFERLDYGGIREVSPGVFWLRMPLPFALNHVNL